MTWDALGHIHGIGEALGFIAAVIVYRAYRRMEEDVDAS